MRAVYLNVQEGRDAELIKIEDKLEVFYELIGCNLIDVAARKIGDHYYDIVVDDEGLFTEKPIISAVDEYGMGQLVGNLVVLQNNGRGDFRGLTDAEIEEVFKEIVFVRTKHKPEGYYALKIK